MPPTSRGSCPPGSRPCFNKRSTARRPHVGNNTDLFPGGFLITKLSKVAPCSCGDALLLGRSLSAGARTVLLMGGATVT